MSVEPVSKDDAVTFQGSNGLWIMLAVLAVLGVVMTLWVAIASISSDGVGALLGIVLKGGMGVALLALGAWFSARQRREVVLDGSGVTIRDGSGNVRAQLAWTEIDGIEERRLPSQPLHPAIILHRADGNALMIDPQQVRDTGALAREAQRRWKAVTENSRQVAGGRAKRR